MKKTFIRCPLCDEEINEECCLAMIEDESDDEIRMFCCEILSTKGRTKYES